MNKKQKINVKISKLTILIAFFLMSIFVFRVCQLGLSDKVDGIDLKKFSSGRNTKKVTLAASRGNIYDINNKILAQNVVSYTVIAFLDESRSINTKKQKHVTDIEGTATKLSPVLGMDVVTLVSLMSQKVYQVELGPGGRSITELKKEEVEALDLPGIDFTESTKRYYPNGDFASYILGYAKNDEKGNTIGELGIEFQFNDKLKGKDGYLEFQKDILRYQIPNTPEVKEPAIEGNDVYLTIDTNIQFFAEQTLKDACKKYTPEWMMAVVADAKTGAILASSSCPSFDPNIRNIENYLNPLVSFEFEPGSTMKTYTYMALIENGLYKGTDTFTSGSKTIGEYTIKDWVNWGWGTINYDQGFLLSSNVGIANLTERYINRDVLKKYYKKLGFGNVTGLSLPKEAEGSLNFTYPIEVAAAGYGQGITTTAIQHIQALTAIANDGSMLKPYLIDKIVNSTNGKQIYSEKKTIISKVATPTTVNKMKDLMHQVVNGDPAAVTGSGYKIDGYDIIGKTGTAQIGDSVNGGYKTGHYDYIRSFAGMFPKDNPKIIVYVAAKRPYSGSEIIYNTTKEIIKNTATYLNVYGNITDATKLANFNIGSYINKKTEDIKNLLDVSHNNYLILGTGNKIINQYPKRNSNISQNDKIILVTNDLNITMPDIIGWSSREVLNLGELINFDVTINGFGYVTSQSIPVGTSTNKDTKLDVELASKY